MGLLAIAARAGVARFSTRFLGRSIVRRVAAPAALGFAGSAAFSGLSGGDGEEGLAPRRRRRKALSATDMRDALVIASSISKKAAETFILMRVRSG